MLCAFNFVNSAPFIAQVVDLSICTCILDMHIISRYQKTHVSICLDGRPFHTIVRKNHLNTIGFCDRPHRVVRLEMHKLIQDFDFAFAFDSKRILEENTITKDVLRSRARTRPLRAGNCRYPVVVYGNSLRQSPRPHGRLSSSCNPVLESQARV